MKHNTLIVLQNIEQEDKDFLFLYRHFNNVKKIILDKNVNIKDLEKETNIYILAYDIGCLLVPQFLRISQIRAQAIFLIRPPLLTKKNGWKTSAGLGKHLSKLEVPVVIFNANIEALSYQHSIADLGQEERMVYNIVISHNDNDILGASIAHQQLAEAIAAYINN